MAIVVVCAKCTIRLTLGDDRAGTAMICPRCAATFTVPQAAPQPRPTRPPLPPPASSPAVPPPPPPARTSRPIVFACPSPACRKQYTVPASRADQVTTCVNPGCGTRIRIPNPKQQPITGNLIVEEAEPPRPRRRPPEPNDPEPIDDYAGDSGPSSFGVSQANRWVAGGGAALLLLGLFLPMLSFPLGIWISFIDLPWKAATLGAQIAGEGRHGDPGASRYDPDYGRYRDRDDAPTAVGVVIFAGVVYPICIVLVAVAAFFQISRSDGHIDCTVGGGTALVATACYGCAVLYLCSQREFRFVSILASPGIGWAVLGLGGIGMCAAGMIRSDERG